jgi:uncharacterized protein (TIGR02266 family)
MIAMSEKRKSDREPVVLFVEYQDADELVGDYTENLSSGGTFIATPRKLAVGSRLRVVLKFPRLLEPVAIEGTVRWTRGSPTNPGLGVEFDAGAARDGLAQMIVRIRDRDPETLSRLFRVLLVEDDGTVVNLISNGLKGSFAVSSAGDGKRALELLRGETPDVVIADYYLPGADGAELIQSARKELGLTKVPIIALSAGGDAARHASLDAGANVFLDKPTRMREIIQTIQRLVT